MVAEHKPGCAEAGFLILRCTGCQNGFLPAESIPPDLEDLYSREYFEGDQSAGYPAYLAGAALLERNFERCVACLSAFVEPGRALDVGTAFGLFLKVANTDGCDVVAGRGWLEEPL